MRDPRCCAGVGDLERSLARLNAAGLGGGMGRDAMKVVLYEDNAKRRVAAMIAGLRGLQTLNEAFKGFHAVLPALASGLLQQLLTPGKGFPELDGRLEVLEGATDWHEAATSGRATPRPVCMSPCSQCLFPLMAMPVTLHPLLYFGCKRRIDFMPVVLLLRDSKILQNTTSHTRVWYCWLAVMHSALSLAGTTLLQSKHMQDCPPQWLACKRLLGLLQAGKSRDAAVKGTCDPGVVRNSHDA